MPRILSALTLALAVFGCEDRKPAEKKAEEPTHTKEAAKADETPVEKKTVAEPEVGGVPKVSSIPKDKWNLTHAEKAWKVKAKQVKFTDVSTSGGPYKDGSVRRIQQYELLFEFAESLTDDEVKTLNRTLSGRGDVEFVYFDSDNVIRERQREMTVSGDATGVKGDAFWVIVRPPYSRGVVRAELRPVRRVIDK